jgi:hypothetical protein
MKSLSMFKAGLVVLIAVLFSLPFSSYAQEVIEIQVSPSTLNLQNNGQVVTVHTEISYSLVVAETVSMNGIVIDSWKADLQGNFVAKFVMEEIVGLPLEIGDYNDLTLDGTKTDGTTFTGTDQVLVIDVVQKGKK